MLFAKLGWLSILKISFAKSLTGIFFLLYAINVKGSNGHIKKPQKGTMILSLLRAGKFQNVPFHCFQSLGDISSLKRFL